eukprot:11179808-Lingulodinium_polyedra.AAC.1
MLRLVCCACRAFLCAVWRFSFPPCALLRVSSALCCRFSGLFVHFQRPASSTLCHALPTLQCPPPAARRPLRVFCRRAQQAVFVRCSHAWRIPLFFAATHFGASAARP